VGNGLNTSFWKSNWIGNLPLAVQFLTLFDLAYDKDISVHKVLESNFDALSFRRRIIGNLRVLFENMLSCCNHFSLSDQDDRIIWGLDKKGFSVNSLYKKESDGPSFCSLQVLVEIQVATENQDFYLVGYEKQNSYKR
jgi:hypothetical protein